MRPIATDRVAWSVTLSVCLSVTTVNLAETAEPIGLKCGLGLAQGTVLDGAQNPHGKGRF